MPTPLGSRRLLPWELKRPLVQGETNVLVGHLKAQQRMQRHDLKLTFANITTYNVTNKGDFPDSIRRAYNALVESKIHLYQHVPREGPPCRAKTLCLHAWQLQRLESIQTLNEMVPQAVKVSSSMSKYLQHSLSILNDNHLKCVSTCCHGHSRCFW